MKIAIALKCNTKYLNFNVSPKLLNADAWHKRSSGKISRNGIRFPLNGSMHVLCLALCIFCGEIAMREKRKKMKMHENFAFVVGKYFEAKINVRIIISFMFSGVWCGLFIVLETIEKCFCYSPSHRELISRSQTETHRTSHRMIRFTFVAFVAFIRQSNSNRFEIQSS